MIKCTVPRLPYSRHKLTYENEAVFFAYSYITTNSQTRANTLCYSAGALVSVSPASRRMAPGWELPSLPPSAASGSRQGSVQELRPQEQGMVRVPWGTRGTDGADWAFAHHVAGRMVN